ncbi:MAG: hypothetical protein AAGA00_02490, partial [Pseudomonadota bacterium]
TVEGEGLSPTTSVDIGCNGVFVMDGGVIRSTGVDVTNNGEHVTFKARVRAIFNSSATQDTPPVTQAETSSAKGNLQQ